MLVQRCFSPPGEKAGAGLAVMHGVDEVGDCPLYDQKDRASAQPAVGCGLPQDGEHAGEEDEEKEDDGAGQDDSEDDLAQGDLARKAWAALGGRGLGGSRRGHGEAGCKVRSVSIDEGGRSGNQCERGGGHGIFGRENRCLRGERALICAARFTTKES